MATNYVHHIVTNTALAYNTFDNPVTTDAAFSAGRNVMTSQRGWSVQYPGFATALCSNTFSDLKRIFIWKKWGSGHYIAMYCDIVGGVSTVWKQDLTIEGTAILIWTSASAEPFDFVDANDYVYFGNGTDMKKYDGGALSAVKRWGMNGPLAAPTIGTSGTGLTAYGGGWFYVTTGYDSVSGHESSPSALSACTGNVSNKQIDITWVPADYDTDADFVRIYRTTDGGSTNPIEMALVASVAKATAAYADTNLDEALSGTTFAPAFYRNDPPPAAKGFCKWAGRIYMFSNDTLYYTGREEIANGVPFECVPGGLDGNFEPFDGEISGVQPRSSGVAVFLGRKIWAWDGATLDTMYPSLLLDRRGAINRTNCYSLGNTVIWFDTAKQVWMDGQEIGRDIRPDLAGLDPNNVSIAVHLSGEYHWLLVCDSASGFIWTYDLDTNQWMPPRDCGASYVYSMNTSDSTIDLLIIRNNRVLKLTPGVFNDDGDAYTSYAVTNLWDMAPAANPDFNGWCHHVSIESNAVSPSICGLLVDDDPDFGTYTTLSTSQPAYNRKAGTSLKETWFMGDFSDNTPSGRRVSFRLDWTTNDWKWYSLDVAIQPAQTTP